MTEFTDYQNLELPEPFNVNERNEWGRILNDALDTIDDKLILSGPLTARPPAQTKGRLFLDNGSGTLYRDNGESWERFGSQTDIQESQSTVSVNPNTINFNRGFTVTEPSFNTAKVEVEDIFIENAGDSMEGTLDLNNNDLVDGTQKIWNAGSGYINQSELQNDSVTVNANDGLKSGGEVALGGSVGLGVEPSDFAGVFLQSDGADNLDVLIGRGLENDGSGNIRIDEGTDFTFTQEVDFSVGLDVQGDIKDGSQVIWDASLQEIPDSALGVVDRTTLSDDRVTITPGDGLKGGGTVSLGDTITHNIEPADFAGDGVKDDGADNIAVEPADFAGAGVVDDGNDNISVNDGSGLEISSGVLQLDESYAATWTTQQTFSGGIDASSSQVTNLPEPTDSTHAARKQYVDGVAQGLSLKESVAASTNGTNVDLTSTTDPNPIDGVTLSDGERVLLKDQTDGTENGIYDAVTATNPTTWVRSPDSNEDDEVTNGLFTFVQDGTSNGSSSYIIVTEDPITLGTTSIKFAQFSSAGEIIAGSGLGKSGQELSINFGDGVELSSDNIRVDEDYGFTFTSKIGLNGGADFNGADLDNVSNIEMDGDINGTNVDISITEVGSIVGPVNGDTNLGIDTQGDGTHTVTIGDGFNNQDIAVFNEGGNVDIRNGILSLGTGDTDAEIEQDDYVSIGANIDGSAYIRFSESNDFGASFGYNGTAEDNTNAFSFRDDLRNEVLTVDLSGNISLIEGEVTADGTNGALEVDERVSVADSGTVQLSRDTEPQGYAMIQDVTNNGSTMVYLGGTTGAVEILHDSGGGNEFTTTEGNDGTTNIYYDGTNGRYEINNETGTSATYSLQILKA